MWRQFRQLRRGFCFWIVPADGKVRKYQISPRLFAISFFPMSILLSAVGFVLFDYTRIQLEKTRQYFALKRVAQERDLLARSNFSLMNRVSSERSSSELLASFEERVRQRIDMLASLMDASAGVDINESVYGVDTDTESDEDLLVYNKKNSEPKAQLALKRDSGMTGAGFNGAGSSSTGAKGGAVSRSKASIVQGAIGGLELDCHQLPMSERGECPQEVPPPIELDQFRQEDSFSGGRLIEALDSLGDMLQRLPVTIPSVGEYTSGYGLRESPFSGRIKFHQGMDLAAPIGSPVEVTADGVVARVTYTPTYGLLIDVTHGSGLTTRYAHLSSVKVSEGAKVCQGQLIGNVGNSGRSTGPHLHYEVLVHGRARNPQKFITLGEELQEVIQQEFAISDKKF